MEQSLVPIRARFPDLRAADGDLLAARIAGARDMGHATRHPCRGGMVLRQRAVLELRANSSTQRLRVHGAASIGPGGGQRKQRETIADIGIAV